MASYREATPARPSPGASAPCMGRAPPGFFARDGRHYRSTALTLYLFTASQRGLFDSEALTRSSSDGHVPVSSSDGDRKEISKMVLSGEFDMATTRSAPPQFGVQMKLDILPVYEKGTFRFVHIIVSTTIDDGYTRLGAVAPAIKLTSYTPTDYFLWLNSLPFLRMLLNTAVAAANLALSDRFSATASGAARGGSYSFRSAPLLEAEARRMAALVADYLAADRRLPALTARPRRTVPAPRLFSEYGATVAEALAACLKRLGTQPAFLTAAIAGCISCSNWVDYVGGSGGRDGVGRVNYAHYYSHELPLTRAARAAMVADDAWAEGDLCIVDALEGSSSGEGSDGDCGAGASGRSTPRSAATPRSGEPSAARIGGGGAIGRGTPPPASHHHQPKVSQQYSSTPGSSWRSTRIVIVGPEWSALPLLLVCTFFYRRGRLLSGADPSAFAHLFGGAAAEDLLPSYVAGQTEGLATGYPILWVDKAALSAEDWAELFDARNDEGVVLVIDAPNAKVTRHELVKRYTEPTGTYGPDGRVRSMQFGAFSLDVRRELELHGDETIAGWLDEAAALAGACGPDVYLQEQLSLVYQRALAYEQLVRSGMLDPYDFNLGFVGVRPPPKPARGQRGAPVSMAMGMAMGAGGGGHISAMPSQRLTAGALSSRSVGAHHHHHPYGNLARPAYDDDERSVGASSYGGSSYGGARGLLGRRASTVGGDDDTRSTTSSIAPSPMGAAADGQARAWMAGLLGAATPEELFVMDHRLRVERLLGAEYTPSHGQLLHLLRFQQPQFMSA